MGTRGMPTWGTLRWGMGTFGTGMRPPITGMLTPPGRFDGLGPDAAADLDDGADPAAGACAAREPLALLRAAEGRARAGDFRVPWARVGLGVWLCVSVMANLRATPCPRCS